MIYHIGNWNTSSVETMTAKNQNASAYNIYRDDDLVNTTTETSYSDFKLKYDEDYTYVLVTIDHHQEEGSKSNPIPGKTHKEVKKIKKTKT